MYIKEKQKINQVLYNIFICFVEICSDLVYFTFIALLNDYKGGAFRFIVCYFFYSFAFYLNVVETFRYKWSGARWNNVVDVYFVMIQL